jgi:hypothetical protein
MKRLALFVIALLLCVNATSAETNVCTLHGTITDETGAAIPNTRVLVQWDSSSKWVSGHQVKDASLRADAYGKFSVQLPLVFTMCLHLHRHFLQWQKSSASKEELTLLNFA